MNLQKISLLFLLVLGNLNSVAQYQLWVQFAASTKVKINSQLVESSVNALVINSDKPDSVRIESYIDSNVVSKLFVLRKVSNQYLLSLNKHHEYKYRLRSNLVFDSIFEVELKEYPIFTAKPLATIENHDSFYKTLEQTKYEFEKVILILEYLSENDVSIESAGEMTGYLNHDFSKWRVVNWIVENTKSNTDLTPLIKIFKTDNYRNKLIKIIETR